MQKLKALEILKEKKKILVGLYNGDDYSDEIDNFYRIENDKEISREEFFKEHYGEKDEN